MNEKIAKHILTLGFDDNDQQRMDTLAALNQEGTLTETEKQELMSYVKTGHLLALIQSKARLYLKHSEDGQ